jgi:chloramphenicol-sensitive protein RarD
MKNKGVFYALGAYFLWGILPIYWKQLNHVPATQAFGSRIVSCFLILILLITLRKEWPVFKQAVFNRKALLLFLLTGLLLGANWLTFIWAVSANHIVETSLGYFINPLVNVALGVLFLREKLRPMQWVPVGMAAVGVIYLTLQYGALPWIALTLAFTFGFYGLLKKTAPTGGLNSMTVEMAFLSVPAITYFMILGVSGEAVFATASPLTLFLLAGTGVITVTPVLLFTAAARSIPLSLVGILQYIHPTLQFLIGVLVYKEAFTKTDLVGYAFVWAALLLFWMEGTLNKRKAIEATRE